MKRTVAATLLALALFAGVIARLRRVAVPVFRPEASFEGGRVQVGRVWLARRGETGEPLGWSVICDGRERRAWMGRTTPLRAAQDADGVTVDTGDGRSLHVSPDCSLR